MKNIELIRESKQDELMPDLKLRTGFNVHRYSIHKIYYYDMQSFFEKNHIFLIIFLLV
jgi:hypothetical protein